jgi:putative oxidoreductase
MAKETGANWGTLIPRFLLATVFVFHGGQTLFGLFGAEPGGMDGMAKMIEAWDWPAPSVLARAAAATEFFGGVCLALGLMTRFWAMGIVSVMAVAVWKVHGANGFSFQKGGWEYCFVLGILALSLAVQGGGALSMDRMFFQAKKKADKPPE